MSKTIFKIILISALIIAGVALPLSATKQVGANSICVAQAQGQAVELSSLREEVDRLHRIKVDEDELEQLRQFRSQPRGYWGCSSLTALRRRRNVRCAASIRDAHQDRPSHSQPVRLALRALGERVGRGGATHPDGAGQQHGRMVGRFEKGPRGSVQRRPTGFCRDDSRPPDTEGPWVLGRRAQLAWALLFSRPRDAPFPHRMLRPERHGAAGRGRRRRGHALPGRPSAVSSRRIARRGGSSPFRLSGRHAVFVAGRHLVDGSVRAVEVPEGFQTLAADRVRKGFNVIQIVAGLYPDMPAFDQRGANEAGFPWTKDYTPIRPEYFNAADRRISVLVDKGLMPCIVGAWGYHLPVDGRGADEQALALPDRAVGRCPWFGASPAKSPCRFTCRRTPPRKRAVRSEGWTEVPDSPAIDPFHRLVTVHPASRARDVVTDPGVLDFDMLQTGHGERAASGQHHPAMVRHSQRPRPCPSSAAKSPTKEFEHLLCRRAALHGSGRLPSVAGRAGHTYGANGIWQVNRREQPYGKSPHGGNNWGTIPWDDAMRLPGSRQVAAAKRLLESIRASLSRARNGSPGPSRSAARSVSPAPSGSGFRRAIPARTRRSPNATFVAFLKYLMASALSVRGSA